MRKSGVPPSILVGGATRREGEVADVAKEKVYSVTVECGNCGEKPDIVIPKGITVTEFFEGVRHGSKWEEPVCSYCKCKTLRVPLK